MCVQRALEIYTRVSLGQFKYVADALTVQSIQFLMEPERRDEFEALLVKAGMVFTGMPPHASFGIHNPNVNWDVKMCAHISHSIRHQLWIDTPEDVRPKTVNSAFPADYVKGLVIPIKKVDNER